MKIIVQQPIPKKKSFQDYERLAVEIIKLPATYDGVGDCIEVPYSPEDARRYIEGRSNYKILIRQIEVGVWRIWKGIRPI